MSSTFLILHFSRLEKIHLLSDEDCFCSAFPFSLTEENLEIFKFLIEFHQREYIKYMKFGVF